MIFFEWLAWGVPFWGPLLWLLFFLETKSDNCTFKKVWTDVINEFDIKFLMVCIIGFIIWPLAVALMLWAVWDVFGDVKLFKKNEIKLGDDHGND